MGNEVFNAGVERGSLNTDYEIRILICWTLNEINLPVTMQQLSFAMLREGAVNYFELVTAVEQLLKSGHLIETNKNKAHTAHMTVTDIGRDTAKTFEKDIPLSVREKCFKSLNESLLLERFERENTVNIVELEDGFKAELSMSDVGNDLLKLSIYLPTRELCEKLKNNFISNPTALYRSVIFTMLGEKFDDSDNGI